MIYILSQAIQSGKTTTIMEAVSQSHSIGGFLSPTVDSLRQLYDINNKVSIDFEKAEPDSTTIRVGRFSFIKESFSTAADWVIEHYSNPNINCIIIDEIGKLELQNEGFDEFTKQLLQLDWTTKDCVLIIRDFLLDDVIVKYKMTDFKIITLTELTDKIDSLS